MNNKNIKNTLYILTFIVCVSQASFAQVGINVSNPKGALDLSASISGIVYPRVALTGTGVQAPVVNPDTGGVLVAGTVVYNTSSAASDPNDAITDVYPGLYVWDGSMWGPQYIQEEYVRFEQDPGCLRVPFGVRTEIDGLETGSSFTPKYSGNYKIKVTTSFGAGEIRNLSGSTGNNLTTGTVEGNFLFWCVGPGGIPTDVLLDGTAMGSNGAVYCHSYSTINENNTPDQQYETVMLDASRVYLRALEAGATYTFHLDALIDQLDETLFVGDMAPGTTGETHIGHETPCTVEFIYVGN